MLGKDNPADLFTKYLDVSTIDHHMESLNFEDKAGRADETPKLHNMSCSLNEYLAGHVKAQAIQPIYVTMVKLM